MIVFSSRLATNSISLTFSAASVSLVSPPLRRCRHLDLGRWASCLTNWSPFVCHSRAYRMLVRGQFLHNDIVMPASCFRCWELQQVHLVRVLELTLEGGGGGGSQWARRLSARSGSTAGVGERPVLLLSSLERNTATTSMKKWASPSPSHVFPGLNISNSKFSCCTNFHIHMQ